MKNLLIAVALFSFFSCRQETRDTNNLAMCHDPKAQFASFAENPEFRKAHPDPLPFDGEFTGALVKFPVSGGADAGAYLVKSRKKTDKYLLLCHEWWGLNDYVKKEADMWSKELKINVLALDLYDGKVAQNSDEAGKYMQGADPKRLEAIIAAAGIYAGPTADFRTMGWCFGGGWSLKAALILKDKVKKCVMYYGMPETDVEKLKTLSTDVVLIHPTQDKWITGEVVAEFEKNMKAAGKKLSVYDYDADHAFANPSSPRYNEAAAKASRAIVKKYLLDK